jgi:hypothetical protein
MYVSFKTKKVDDLDSPMQSASITAGILSFIPGYRKCTRYDYM